MTASLQDSIIGEQIKTGATDKTVVPVSILQLHQ